MSRLKITAVAIALGFAPFSASYAQDAEAPAPLPVISADAAISDEPVSPEPTPADIAFQEKSDAFEADNKKFQDELQAVLDDSTLDKTTKIARGDELIFAFTPTLEAFSVVLRDYLIERANHPINAEQKDAIMLASENLPAQLYVAPAHLRDAIRRDVEMQNP